MKCPRCGSEMVMDEHRKMDLYMCYDCGYVEGNSLDDTAEVYHETGIEHLHSALNESVSTLEKELGTVEHNVNSWAKNVFYKYIR